MSVLDVRAAVERQQHVVLDLDIAVDDARVQIDRDVDQLRDAVRERDRAHLHLQHLIESAPESA